MTDISPNSPNSETSALDDLYGRILSAAFQVANAGENMKSWKVLRAVISVRTPLLIDGLSKLPKIKAENLSEVLSSLHSVVYDTPEFGSSYLDVLCLQRVHHNKVL